MAVGTSPYATDGAGRLSSEPIRVLIADDEPALRVALADLLSQEIDMVLIGSAADADEAIALAGDQRPDVALVDVSMPAGGGARAAREISRCSPATRVIALSAFEDRPTVLDMLRAGAVGYLVKGTAGEEIVGSIQKVMAGGASLSSEVVAGIVSELTTKLRRDEEVRELLDARRSEIERFVAGDGVSMVFQPIVELATEATVGFEALARFDTSPPKPPDEWFAEAVALSLGVQLELRMVRRALRALPRIDPSRYLAVNCSYRAAISSELAALLEPHAERLVLEITEHEAVEDYDHLVDALAPLRARGARVAIDDAGAGFASLRHTLRIAPDIVKLDLSLTRDIDTDRAKRALATALVSFAQEVGSALVAEGIETAQELETLRELGVGYGQGFFLAAPGELG
ncbi:MAG TPA: EAL domain-containing protein [Actinomycetota bacterium]|jgi:EAL domain-containing protein (putative c-di-GMP-specific phosphodiesterase class I)